MGAARNNIYGQRNDQGLCACAECSRQFAGLTTFDAHAVPEHPDGTRHGNTCGCSDWWPRCADDDEIRAKGYERDGRGRWRSTRTGAPPWVREGSTRTDAGVVHGQRGEGAEVGA